MFDNKTMRQPVKGKPHIVLINGLWRVSPLQRGSWQIQDRWVAAHEFIRVLNRRIIANAQ